MPRCSLALYITNILRQMHSVKFFFLVSFISLTLSVIWIQLASRSRWTAANESLVNEALENVARDYRYSEVYRKTSKLPKDYKYILLWTRRDFAPFYYFGEGQRTFLKNNCSMINCYVTTDRNFFNGDITKFDAIAFNGRNMKRTDLPKQRSMKQKYIYFNMESADNFPVCHKDFEGFFNWTSTYKLDSDIPLPYLQIRDTNGEILGPKIEMVWATNYPDLDEEYSYRLLNKTKAAAWFVSHCTSRSSRKTFVGKLQRALKLYGHSVDVYGFCGPFSCPRNKMSECNLILERDYHFYMSLENSFADDYVTEKLLTAMQHDIVPIIYGGANYSRFLPPGAYIDGLKYEPEELAYIMDRLMNNPDIYREYFKWKNLYTYHDPTEKDNVCAVCAALNNKDSMDTYSTYDEFRKWWHPNYTERCK